ncbi:hypothetical protein [Celeribacter sp.]|uniref:hypothetical protein n=1 Tax=Celeribacter sp. TaxID=1890673 RepID=UPI003A8E35B7
MFTSQNQPTKDTSHYRISMFRFQFDVLRHAPTPVSLIRSALKALALAGPLCFSASGTQADPMPPLSELAGHTLVGATVESYAVWSVYLSPNGPAQFTYANGERGEAAWRVAGRNILCFDFEGSGKEVCKRGSTYGTGSGWSTVDPQPDGSWRPFQEDPHGSSRIFAAWPGYVRHNPASFTGDLTGSLPGTVYIDDPGSGIWAAEFRPDGRGTLLTGRATHEVESTSYGARRLCLQEECVTVQVKDGRLALYKDDSDRLEGYLIYLAMGRFTAPPAPAPVTDTQDTQMVAAVETSPEEVAQDRPADASAGEDCDGVFYAGGDCNIVTNEALSKDITRAVESATTPPDETGETPPAMAAPEIIYPWFGRSADLMIQRVGTRDKRGQTRVDFKDGSPRIGGRVLVPSFTPDNARIVAASEALALIRYSGPMLPEGCAEAYRWLWVDAADHGLLSEPFGSCSKADDITVHYRGSWIVTTITPDTGVPSTFEIFPYRSDGRDALRLSVTAGPSVDFEPVSEEDWKTIERRAADAQRAADAERAKEDARRREADWLARKAADLAALRKPATPTGQLDGGNAFDILAQKAVQSAIASAEHSEVLTQILSEHFTQSVHLPRNERVGETYIGLACGPEGCGKLLVGMIYNSRTRDAFGFINVDFTAIRFGTDEWLKQDPSAQAITEAFDTMIKAMPTE